MSTTSLTAAAGQLSPSSLFVITVIMMVMLLAVKLLLKEMSHAPVILLSFGISFLLVP